MFTVSIVSHNHGVMVVNLIKQLINFKYVDKIILTINIPEVLNLPLNNKIIIIENSSPRGFGANHNTAFLHSSSHFFTVLNPDVIFLDNIFEKLLLFNSDFINGIYSPQAINSFGTPEDNWRKFPTLISIFMKFLGFDNSKYYFNNNFLVNFPVNWVSGLFMIIPSSIFKSLDGFNEKYYLYYEDVDICFRASLLKIPVYACPYLRVIHLAQRDSRKKITFFIFHLKSLLRFLFTSFLYSIRRIFD